MRRDPPSILIAAFFALVALPLLATLALPSQNRENRRLAPPPAVPRSLAAAAAFPRAADAWIEDRFGLRDLLVGIDDFVRWHGFGELPSDRVVAGRGRFFLGAHDGAAPYSLITGVCGAEVPPGMIGNAEREIRAVLATLSADGLRPTLLLVPTAARLYPDLLPAALRARCAGAAPPVDRIVAALDDPEVVYPLDRMRALARRGVAPIPPYNFHWAGEAPLRIAEAIAEADWHLPRVVDIPLRRIDRRSDLAGIVPGLLLSDRIREPQLRAIGMRRCVAAACAAEAGLPPGAARALEHYGRDGDGPVLLVIADSFGDEIARDFLEQFRGVWHLHTNVVAGLPEADRAALADWIRRRFRGDHVLLVYHDLAAADGPGAVERFLAGR